MPLTYHLLKPGKAHLLSAGLHHITSVGLSGPTGVFGVSCPRYGPLLHQMEQYICPWLFWGLYKGASHHDIALI